MLLKFTSLELQPVFPHNTKFRADIFKNDEVIDILVWVGLARKLPGLQYLRASCSMHAISRYWETRPKIIDFILFVGSEKSLWLSHIGPYIGASLYCLLEMTTISGHACTETFAPLVYWSIDDFLVKPSPLFNEAFFQVIHITNSNKQKSIFL